MDRVIKRKIILASASPRRKEILGKLNTPFEICVSGCDESTDIQDPAKLVARLSELKASDVFGKNGKALVIGADTVVAHNGHIMGKPHDRNEAVNMIREYAGDVHQVYTGVTIIVPELTSCEKKNIENITSKLKRYAENISVSLSNDNMLKVIYSVRTEVEVAHMSEEEIENYVSGGEPMDKAGAYAIQGDFAPYISRISGDYYNVVGLPVSTVYSIIKNFV